MQSKNYICRMMSFIKIRTAVVVSSLVLITACRSRLQISNVAAEKNKAITADIPENKNFTEVIAPYKAELEGKMNTKISHTATELNKSGDNSNLGQILADYTYEGAAEYAQKKGLPKIDAAVINIGGIRNIIGKGDIYTKNIYEVMPFENEIVIVKMKGSAVQGLFDYYAKTQKNNPVSHLYIETDQGKIVQQLIDGKALVENQDYYIATSDYLALGGDNMNFFGKGEIISTGIKMRDLFLEKFIANPEITTKEDIRLLFKNKKTEK